MTKTNKDAPKTMVESAFFFSREAITISKLLYIYFYFFNKKYKREEGNV